MADDELGPLNPPDAAPPPAAEMPSFTEEEKAQGYAERKWRTYTNYECCACQYSTLWLEKMAKHLHEGTHVWAHPSPQSGLSPVPHTDGLEY